MLIKHILFFVLLGWYNYDQDCLGEFINLYESLRKIINTCLNNVTKMYV
jgi:hypothetical protein